MRVLRRNFAKTPSGGAPGGLTTRETKYGIGEFKWSHGKDGLGRKVFHKGWKHMEPRRPMNLQERWHRAAIERLFHPSIIESIGVREMGGPLHTLEWRMAFETTSLDWAKSAESKDIAEYKKLSPWHDLPVGFECTQSQRLLFNFVNEINRGDRAKMECATDEEWNPIKQDTKKGQLRFFKYGDLPFNYGFIPQTWEDPSHESAHCDIPGLTGDNDPVDVVELSETPLGMGEVVPMKVLGLLGLVDEGETDWKIIGLRANHPLIDKISTLDDAEKHLNGNFREQILDWFRNYKIPDGKPANSFTHNESYLDPEKAIEVIEECHRQWYSLMLGATKSDLNKTSVTLKHLVAQGVATESDFPDFPNIEYPRYEAWSAKPTQRLEQVDNAYEEYAMDEPSPDQAKK